MDEKTVTMMEGVAREWRVRVKDSAGNVLDPAGFSFYGGAADGVQVQRRMQVRVEGDVAVLRLPGLWMSGRCWRYQVLCQDVLTGVEWVLCQGDVVLERRVACNGPALHEDAVLVDAVLNSEQEQVDVYLGDSTTATAEAARLASAARAGAEAGAARAEDAAAKAEDLKRVALDAAAGAALSAEGAEDSKRGAAAAAVDAAADAQLAEGAAAEAEVSREAAEAAAKLAGARAAEADASAKVAADAVSDALAARDEAAAARGGAEECERVAALRAGEAEDSADEAGVARAGAEAAQVKAEAAHAEAEAARVKAERSADEAEQNAALLGDAALRGADNVFSGVNSFVGGLLVENNMPLLVMMAAAFRVPLAAALAETSADYIAKMPATVPGEDWFVFMPRVANFDYSEKFNNSSVYKGRCFAVVPNLMNPCGAAEINAVVFGERKTCVINPYRCNVLNIFFSGKKAGLFVSWGHNAFTQAPDIFIDAPYMTGYSSGLVASLRTVGTCRLRMPSLKQNFTLKIGAIKREDVLYLLENLPDLKGEKRCTAALSCDPALEGDADFLAAVAAFYDAETGTGWDVGLTFQQNEKFNEEAAAAATYGLRRPRAVPVYAKRVPSEGGAWVDVAGERWDLMTAHWVADEADWCLFDDEVAAVEEWGLTEMAMEEAMAANETLTENK